MRLYKKIKNLFFKPEITDDKLNDIAKNKIPKFIKKYNIKKQEGILTGGALCELFLNNIYGTNYKPKDIDIFSICEAPKKMKNNDEDEKFTGYKFNKYNIKDVIQDGILEFIEVYKDDDIKNYKSIVDRFDLNYAQVSYNLETKELYYTQSFFNFLKNNKLKFEDNTTLSKTILRYFDKVKKYGEKYFDIKEVYRFCYYYKHLSPLDEFSINNEKFIKNKNEIKKYFFIENSYKEYYENGRKEKYYLNSILKPKIPYIKYDFINLEQINIFLELSEFQKKVFKYVNYYLINKEYFDIDETFFVENKKYFTLLNSCSNPHTSSNFHKSFKKIKSLKKQINLLKFIYENCTEEVFSLLIKEYPKLEILKSKIQIELAYLGCLRKSNKANNIEIKF